MNRELKFRFWRDKKRLAQDMYAIYDGGVYCHETGNVYKYDEIIVEQYTGLTDKNGKDIYEGDIVKGFQRSNLLIEFKGGAFMYKNDENNYFYMVDKFSIHEVIGNIHKNPELLEKDNTDD